ncbi:MAG: DNA primase [Chthoniobacterales bacterium]|nr:DNA primase [Chthoniobacterales bacterium]
MPRIAEESIERVAAATDIVEVIGSYFPLKRAGSSWRALCPFHREKSPSFHVSPQKQAYYCFGCGAGGSVFKFVMEYERVDFGTAVRRLAQRAGVVVVEEQSAPGEERRHELRGRLLELHKLAADWFHHNLLRSASGANARDYLKSRAIGSDIAKNWHLGYAPDSRDALLKHARSAGFRDDELQASGLFHGGAGKPPADRFRQRLMFPICNDFGEVIAFSGRVLPPSEDPAKYVNSPETPLFNKGRALFGLHKARRPLADTGTAIVCEGQLDLIRIFESGMENVVAPQGTAFTPSQARLLKRYADTAVLCFDSDRAGRTAVERSLPILLASGFAVRVAALPPGEDPDSLIRSQGAEKFRELMESAPDYFDFAVDEAARSGALDNAQKKAALARKLAAFAASLPDAVGREAIAARLAPRLAISPQAFLAAVPKTQPAHPADSGTEEQPDSEKQGSQPDPVVRLLLHAALSDLNARQWLAQQDAGSFLAGRAGTELLAACLRSDFDPADEAAARLFLAAQSSDDQSLVASLLVAPPPIRPDLIARETLLNLRKRSLDARREGITSQLRQPGLPSDEVVRLQSEVVDIMRQLRDLSGSQ